MAGNVSENPVIGFYDTHPINEEQILRALESRRVPLTAVTEDVLKEFDQDHYGGIAAVDTLARKAGIRPEHHVLDVCSGMGGPARYLAHGIGCRVTGLDFTESRHLGAQRLTRLAGLDGRVDFRLGDAQAMPLEDAAYDVVIGQEAWAHVPDKGRLIRECARVVKPGGTIAFTDILARGPLPPAVLERLRQGMTFAALETLAGYGRLLSEAGCTVIEAEDLSAPWTEILNQRLAMYRSLKDETVRKFGLDHFRRYDDAYAFFVGLYVESILGGGRIIARRERRPG